MNILMIFIFLLAAALFGYMAYKGVRKVQANRVAQNDRDPNDRSTISYLPGLLMAGAGAVLAVGSIVMLVVTFTGSM